LYSGPVPTAADRVIADVSLAERLSVGMYGEVYRAHGRGRRDLRALIADSRLVVEPAFASALAGTPPELASFHHRSVVGTLAVVRDGADLVVVTEAVNGPVALFDLLADVRTRGGKLPPAIAAAIARSVIDGLATAHGMGLVHGAVHPRSVLIDFDGAVKLADFAAGRALAIAIASGADPTLARGLTGYLAPEVAAGELPGPAADVWGAGALFFSLLTGEVPPGSLRQTPAVERLVQRALDPDLHRRFADAVALQENLAEALEDDGWQPASPIEIARFVGDNRSSADANLDAATEDLLAALGDKGGPTYVVDLEELGGPEPSADLESVIADLDDDVSEPLTQVDPAARQLGRDPISEIIAIHGDPTEDVPTNVAPEPGRRRAGSIPRRLATPIVASAAGDDDRDPTPLPAPRTEDTEFPGRRILLAEEPALRPAAGGRTTDAALAALAELDTEVGPPPPSAAPRATRAQPAPPVRFKRGEPRTATPEVAVIEPPHTLARRSLGWVSALFVLAGVAALVWVVRNQKDDLAAQEQLQVRERERAAAETTRLTAELPDPGAIAIRSNPDGAAVWLLLGRTPMDSLILPTSMPHELRIELDGHKPKDVVVGASAWSGAADARVARLTDALEPGAPARPLPAVPPRPPADAAAGLTAGRGRIHVESTPAGAAVWLLVGITNDMELSGIEAGRDYDLRVQKDGFVPGYVRINAEEWRAGGDPRLPLSAAPKKPTLEKQVDLIAERKKGR